jgi:hypothetical protein
MTGYWGNGCIAPCIVDLGTEMEVSGQLHTSTALTQGKSSCYPLDMRLGGNKSRSGRGGEEKNSQPAGTRTPDHPARNPALYKC